MYEEIRFPHLGIVLEHVGKSIDVFGFSIAYYGIIIAAGMMAAMLARGGARGRVLRTMDITQRMGYAARVKTNVISGSFLVRSSQGLLSADVLDTVGQLFSNGPTQSLESAASRVISFGETSGTDILSGIYFGAKI